MHKKLNVHLTCHIWCKQSIPIRPLPQIFFFNLLKLKVHFSDTAMLVKYCRPTVWISTVPIQLSQSRNKVLHLIIKHIKPQYITRQFYPTACYIYRTTQQCQIVKVHIGFLTKTLGVEMHLWDTLLQKMYCRLTLHPSSDKNYTIIRTLKLITFIKCQIPTKIKEIHYKIWMFLIELVRLSFDNKNKITRIEDIYQIIYFCAL